MDLHPCASCHRHIDARYAACPFCHVARAAAPTTSLRASLGRLSRAAVFAGAAACGGSSTASHHTTPPPPPPDPVIVQQFATAPPPAEGKASIRGFVTRDGYPLAGVAVHARNGDTTVDGVTGSKGEFAFVDLEPGQWRLALDPDEYDTYRYSRRPQEGPMMMPDAVVNLGPGQNERYDIGFSTPPPPEPDRGPCCKPYGAPPARRRVV